MTVLVNGGLGVAGLGDFDLGGPQPVQGFALPAMSTTALGYIAHLYDINLVFKRTLGGATILNKPGLKLTQNAGYQSITIDLATPVTGLVLGDVIRLTENGDNTGTFLYSGNVETTPEEVTVGATHHQISITPWIAELGDAYFNQTYSAPTDVAQFVRDAVRGTAHCSVNPISCPDSGLKETYDFQTTNALDAIHVAKQIAGAQWWWGCDAEGVVWFQPVVVTPAATIQPVSGIFGYNSFTGPSQGSLGAAGSSNLEALNPTRKAKADALLLNNVIPGVGGISHVIQWEALEPFMPINDIHLYDWTVTDQALAEIARYPGAKVMFRINAGSSSGAPNGMIGGGTAALAVDALTGASTLTVRAMDQVPAVGQLIQINAYPGQSETFAAHAVSGKVITLYDVTNTNPATCANDHYAIGPSPRNGIVEFNKAIVAWATNTAYAVGDTVRMPAGTTNAGNEIKDNLAYVCSQTITALQNNGTSSQFLALAGVAELIEFANGDVMACPWDPVVQAHRQSFIAAFGARYNGNPRIAMIQMSGAGYLGEGTLHQQDSDQGVTAIWMSHGYTDWRYIAAWQFYIDAYAAAFPNTPLALDIDEPWGMAFNWPTAVTLANCTTNGTSSVSCTSSAAATVGDLVSGHADVVNMYVGSKPDGTHITLSSSPFSNIAANATGSHAGLTLYTNSSKRISPSCTTVLGSKSVADATVRPCDQGKKVTGHADIPTGSYIGLVGAASSGGAGTYDLSTSNIAQLDQLALGGHAGIALTYAFDGAGYNQPGVITAALAGTNTGGSGGTSFLPNDVYVPGPQTTAGYLATYPGRVYVQQNGLAGTDANASTDTFVLLTTASATGGTTLTETGSHFLARDAPGAEIGVNVTFTTHGGSATVDGGSNALLAVGQLVRGPSSGTTANDIPFNTYVGSLIGGTGGTSFTLSSSPTSNVPVNANTGHVGVVLNFQLGIVVTFTDANHVIVDRNLPNASIPGATLLRPGDRNRLGASRNRQIISSARSGQTGAPATTLRLAGGGYQMAKGGNRSAQIVTNALTAANDDGCNYVEVYYNDILAYPAAISLYPFDGLLATGSKPATLTLRLGVDYNSRKKVSSIQGMRNKIPVLGGSQPGDTTRLQSLYDGVGNQALYGVRAFNPTLVYPSVVDKATLDAIAASVGAQFDRVITTVELTCPALGRRLTPWRAGGVTVRFWEPAQQSLQQSAGGAGDYSPTYILQDVETNGPSQKLIVGDSPYTDIDTTYEAMRVAQRMSASSATPSPVPPPAPGPPPPTTRVLVNIKVPALGLLPMGGGIVTLVSKSFTTVTAGTCQLIGQLDARMDAWDNYIAAPRRDAWTDLPGIVTNARQELPFGLTRVTISSSSAPAVAIAAGTYIASWKVETHEYNQMRIYGGWLQVVWTG